jgi:transposase
MRLEEEVIKLRAENAALRQQVETLSAQVASLTERLRELEGQKPEPPSFVKPNRPGRKGKEGGRKKRASEHNRGRKREKPTQIERHALERCPGCTYQLRGESLQYRRQVIELPEPQPVTVTEHQIIKRWCPVCRAWQAPRITWQEQVVGQGRVGVRLAALVGYLRQSLRLPLRQIQAYLVAVHQVQLSVGELNGLLQRMRQHVQGAISALKATAQGQAVLHGDETGWREDGQNGYVWCLASGGTEPVRYYEYDASRSQAVVQRLLEGFGGHLVSDFLGSYNVYSGPHQRCWVHLLRDLKKLQEEQSENSEVVAWALAVRWQYEHARSEAEGLGVEERQALYQRLRRQTELLGLQYAQVKQHPCQALAKRLLRHMEELYQFVLHPQVRADNNLAERALRPVVVQRKISGGTRSPAGSQTRLGLASLFETWHARGLNPLAEFQRLLIQPPHAPP